MKTNLPLLALLLLLPSLVRAELTLFAPNSTPAPIYVERTAKQKELETAADLARVLGRMSGHSFSVRWASPRMEERGIYLLTGASDRMIAEPRLGAYPLAVYGGKLVVDYSEIELAHTAQEGDSLARINLLETLRAICEKDRLYLIGEDAEGLALTVYWFLQRYGGVRWFSPGELGEYIPKRETWQVAPMNTRAQPAYLSRRLYAPESPSSAYGRWARRNLLRDHVAFSHNMWTLFSHEDFRANPDWLPSKGGRQYPLESYSANLWQPDLTHPETATHTIKQITQYFDKKPDALSFAIGLNDTVYFGDAAAAHHLTTPRKWFRERPDYSELVFDWSNKVAAGVAQKHPGKLIGTLAYFWNENTPEFLVEPNLVPYVTADRSQYYDEAFREEDLALLDRWAHSGARLTGIYDYIYGSSFLVPRISHEYLEEAVHKAYSAGHRAYFAELVPQWPYDAAKAWMVSRMLYGTDLYEETAHTGDRAPLPLNKLKNEFLTSYYGNAAEAMNTFFTECEVLWKAQPGSARWIKYYRDPYVIALFPPDALPKLEESLVAAETAVMHDSSDYLEQQQYAMRVAGTRRAYMALAAASRYYHQLWNLERVWSKKLHQGDAVYLELLDLAKQRAALPMLFSSDDYPSGFQRPSIALFKDDALLRLFSEFVQELNNMGGVSERFFSMIEEEFFLTMRSVFGADVVDRKLRQSLGDRLLAPENLLRNPGFEELDQPQVFAEKTMLRDSTLPQWWSDARDSEHLRIEIATDASRTGQYGLRVQGADIFRAGQFVKAEEGTLLSFTAYMRGTVAYGARVGLRITWFDAEGQQLLERKGDRLPHGPTDGWVRLNAIDIAPIGASWARCTFDITGQPADHLIDMDDATVSILNTN